LTDDLQIFTGASRSNVTVLIEDLKTTFFTDNTETASYDLQIVQNNNTPSNGRTIANIHFIAEDTTSIDTIYAIISASSNNVTNGSEDGLLQFGVASNGATLRVGFEMEGNVSAVDGVNLGFYGQTMVARQTLASNPTNTEISTVLRNLGLTKL